MSRVLPILFNTDMVRAILDGRRMVTRRVIKPQPLFRTARKFIFADDVCPKKWEDCDNIIKTYQYQPGDILYVRETWARLDCCSCEGDDRSGSCFEEPDNNEGCYAYRATHEIYGDIKWRPSIHMPKEAARIWLKVTDVRVERLQDITVIDCGHEGIDTRADGIMGRFSEVWDSTIKKSDRDRYGWEANLWVWVIEFERCEKPEE